MISHDLFREGFRELMEIFEVIFPEKRRFSAEELKQVLPEIEALIPTYAFKVTSEIIDAAPKLKIIANYGTGYDNIDTEYATKKGIIVTNVPDPVVIPTAELTFGLILSLTRRICECDRKLRLPDGLKLGLLENLGTDVHGKTLGIVGLGKIGQALARYALASEMPILYTQRHRLDIEIEKLLHATYVPFDKLLKQSDIISIHTPITAETYHLFSDKKFSMMKDTSFLINTSRGAVIDESALIRALQNKKIAGAGLDVFEHEPKIPRELLEMDNVVLTPHSGTATIDTRNAMSRRASSNVIRFFEGRQDIDRVN